MTSQCLTTTMLNMDPKETLQQFYRERAAQKQKDAEAERSRYESLLPQIVEGIRARDPDVARIILFGSLAERSDGIVRDIDIAVESTDFLKATGWLLSLPYPVDVVAIGDLYPHIRQRVEEKGRILYERS